MAEKSLSAIRQLETREGWWQNSVQIPGPENQRSWGCKSSWGAGEEERRCPSSTERQETQGNFLLPPTVVLFGSLMRWLTPTLGLTLSLSVSMGEDYICLPVYPSWDAGIDMSSSIGPASPDTPSDTRSSVVIGVWDSGAGKELISLHVILLSENIRKQVPPLLGLSNLKKKWN